MLQVRQEAPEVRARGQEHGEVIQAEQAATRHRPNARALP